MGVVGPAQKNGPAVPKHPPDGQATIQHVAGVPAQVPVIYQLLVHTRVLDFPSTTGPFSFKTLILILQPVVMHDVGQLGKRPPGQLHGAPFGVQPASTVMIRKPSHPPAVPLPEPSRQLPPLGDRLNSLWPFVPLPEPSANA